jgi:SAM-dependent methyltransferase
LHSITRDLPDAHRRPTVKRNRQELAEALRLKEFPRSAKHEPEWVIENLMGPNVLWLTESLTQVMKLEPGMRVLDMGCGRAISSIFLAKEFDVEVWATDLWIAASDNMECIQNAGVEDRVFPVHAEAYSLPFARDFFDAIVSMDAYHYYGTDDLYIGGHFAHLVKPRGQIGIVVPGLTQELPSPTRRSIYSASGTRTTGAFTARTGGPDTGSGAAWSR